MNTDILYAPPGTKVTFLNKNGYDGDRKRAGAVGLIEGETYTLVHVDVGSCHSTLTLEGYGGEQFNTVMFDCEYVEPYEGWMNTFIRYYG